MRHHRFWWGLCNEGMGRAYGHTGDDTEDCVRLLFAALLVWYPDVADIISSEIKALHLNGEPLGSTENVDAVIRLGLGEEVKGRPPPGATCYCQGWRTPTGGHSFAILVPFGAGYLNPDGDPDLVWIVEATSPRTDWSRPVLWADLVKKYPHAFRVAALREP